MKIVFFFSTQNQMKIDKKDIYHLSKEKDARFSKKEKED